MSELTSGLHSPAAVVSGKPAEVIAVGWQDLCGITRVRAIPAAHLQRKAATGLGFPTCGQALTSSGGIVANRWGPMGDVRQLPILSTCVRVPPIGDYPGMGLVMSDSVDIEGNPFPTCGRSFLNAALAELKDRAGLELATAFEHEFTLRGDDLEPELCMTLDALRAIEPLPGYLVAALDYAGIETEAIEPEFGRSQYELSTAHRWGITGADQAVVTREIIRDVARHFGLRASFTPKIAPGEVGNGAHIHFSLRDAGGNPVLFDADKPHNLSDIGARFTAGIIRHLNAIMAFAASTPVSYMRLGPGKWSSGFNAFGASNREAVIRVCDLPMTPLPGRAHGYNLEFRAADNTSNVYILLAMMVKAGLQGVLDKLDRPQAVDIDPGQLSTGDRKRLGIEPLPATLQEALKCLEQDRVARAWLPVELYETFMAVKQQEIDAAALLSEDELCARYADVY
jgi:glutamine synthetase